VFRGQNARDHAVPLQGGMPLARVIEGVMGLDHGLLVG
jgi:hypothetical protein